MIFYSVVQNKPAALSALQHISSKGERPDRTCVGTVCYAVLQYTNIHTGQRRGTKDTDRGGLSKVGTCSRRLSLPLRFSREYYFGLGI